MKLGREVDSNSRRQTGFGEALTLGEAVQNDRRVIFVPGSTAFDFASDLHGFILLDSHSTSNSPLIHRRLPHHGPSDTA